MQYETIPVSRPDINQSDISSVTKAMEAIEISGHSSYVGIFEDLLKEYLEVQNVITVSNGSDAIDLVIDSLNLEKGDECLIPTFTIISTISQVARSGCKIKLIDADPNSWSLDTLLAASAISPKTKLVLPVHIYGLAADIEAIVKLKQDFDFFLLEDSAESLGTEYLGRKCGTIGDAGTFSFYANKIITTGEGGAICTNDSDLANKLRSKRNLSFDPVNRFVHESFGWNSRLSGIASALGISQLMRIGEMLEKKQLLAKRYLESLKNHPWIDLPLTEYKGTINKYWVFGVIFHEGSPLDGTSASNLLREKSVETRRFFCPMHLQPVMRNVNYEKIGSMKVSERLWERGIYLPMGGGITLDEVDRVCEALWSLI